MGGHMERIQYIIYRYLTAADFYNMYKPPTSEAGGGGQKYIDFSTKKIPLLEWDAFFASSEGLEIEQAAKGPRWNFNLYSIGVDEVQNHFYFYQRRSASICCPNQHINTRGARRVLAWLPQNGFPEPADPVSRNQLPTGLAIFLVKTTENKIFAGWLLREGQRKIYDDKNSEAVLHKLLDVRNKPGDCGFIDISSHSLFLNKNLKNNFFNTSGHITSETSYSQEIDNLEDFFLIEDTSSVEEVQRLVSIRKRNSKAVELLKTLYNGKCQISGEMYSFAKKDGSPYCEGHHLVPLGEGGADDPRNIVIVSPLLHRMLHYANVQRLDLKDIKKMPDGSWYLDFLINGQKYTIRWHQSHLNVVNKASS